MRMELVVSSTPSLLLAVPRITDRLAGHDLDVALAPEAGLVGARGGT